ncbi:MAG TPA: S9 family peptidase [Anaerolineae bacterium]|nr:S9 family peptidase [Anaerolineae bacterium]
MITYPIARYLHVRNAYWPTFSSDGRHLAFLTDITGLPQVWRVALPMEQDEPTWPDQLTFGGDRVLDVHYSPATGDGRLIFSRDVGGNENAQLYLLPADGSGESLLTAGYESAMHTFGEWSGDGQRILFAANRRDAGLFDLYVQALDGEAQMVWKNETPGYLVNVHFSPHGQRAALTRMQSSFHHELFEVDLASGTARKLLATEEDVRYLECEYATDGRSLYLNTDLGADYLHVARLDLASGELETLAAPDWDCEAMCLTPDGRRLAYAVNVDGARRLHVLDLVTGATREGPPVADVPGLLADGRLAFSPEGRRVAFSFTTATHTADVHVWDVESDAIRPVTRSSHGGIPRNAFVAPELVRYPTFDRDEDGEVRQIPAWFYVPREAQQPPYPVVVLVHGGPEGQYSPGFHPVIQYLLASGYAILAPNVRGSTGYGKAYSHLDDVEKRMDSVADLAYAAYWLRDQPDIDGERSVVYGGSYGGFMVLSALTAYPDLWRAGVDIVGISNLVTFLENTSDYRRAHREAEYGSLVRDRAFLEGIAPINHIDRFRAPLMVIHGANDPRVPLSEAEQLVDALETRGIPVEFLVFADEGHGLVKLQNKLVAYPAIVAFLERYVLA